MNKEKLSCMTPSGIMSNNWYAAFTKDFEKAGVRDTSENFGAGLIYFGLSDTGTDTKYELEITRPNALMDSLNVEVTYSGDVLFRLFISDREVYCAWYEDTGIILVAETSDEDFNNPCSVTEKEYNLYAMVNPVELSHLDALWESFEKFNDIYNGAVDENGNVDRSLIQSC
ncbi:hypothetical protein [Burkholderia pseudomallei]|jgi:hypothetical protein|uniref:hypothetical protein n=1 Tax=Burkholderia pseudomallei TaxID=28450 RepID=UPI0024DFB190|nr:hypothetical protein [Burkholderia pseudomallei]